MGRGVVPWILRDLEANRGFWRYAIEGIAGEDPVGSRTGVDHDEMRECRLRCGRRRWPLARTTAAP